jgi:hypothetical protein
MRRMEHDTKQSSVMRKADALRLFDTTTGVARAIGCTPQAISQWPEVLTPMQRDRVQAALWRRAQVAGVTRKRRKRGPKDDDPPSAASP